MIETSKETFKLHEVCFAIFWHLKQNKITNKETNINLSAQCKQLPSILTTTTTTHSALAY